MMLISNSIKVVLAAKHSSNRCGAILKRKKTHEVSFHFRAARNNQKLAARSKIKPCSEALLQITVRSTLDQTRRQKKS